MAGLHDETEISRANVGQPTVTEGMETAKGDEGRVTPHPPAEAQEHGFQDCCDVTRTRQAWVLVQWPLDDKEPNQTHSQTQGLVKRESSREKLVCTPRHKGVALPQHLGTGNGKQSRERPTAAPLQRTGTNASWARVSEDSCLSPPPWNRGTTSHFSEHSLELAGRPEPCHQL